MELMVHEKGLQVKQHLEKMNENLEKQGVNKNQRRLVIITALEELKRKHLSEE